MSNGFLCVTLFLILLSDFVKFCIYRYEKKRKYFREIYQDHKINTRISGIRDMLLEKIEGEIKAIKENRNYIETNKSV